MRIRRELISKQLNRRHVGLESMIGGCFFDLDGADGMTLRGRIKRSGAGQFIFCSFEFEGWAADAVGQAGEFDLTVGVGAGFEIELTESAHAVSDVDFDVGGVDRLAVGGVDGDIE